MNFELDTRTIVAAILLIAVVVVVAAATTAIHYNNTASGFVIPGVGGKLLIPIVVSGDNNVYIVWSSDKGTPNKNGEVIFRASTDGGKTLGNKTNLSNTPTADSVDASIAAAGSNVYITWWERNQTSNEPIMRISNDNGKTFGPIIMLGNNGTLASGGRG
jgi:hypothetical protein